MDRLERLRNILDGSKAVIFDFDNVIADSEPYHYKAYSQVFASLGHTIDRDEYWVEWTSKGGGAEGEIERHSLPFEASAIRELKDPVYSSFCTGGDIPLFPDAVRIIRSFLGSGFILAIASGSYERDIRAILSGSSLESLFSCIVGKDGITRTKPDPETYRVALERLDLSPQECFAIEDAEKGVISAHAAGMKVITVETEVTRGFDLGDSDLALSGLGELYGLMIEAGLSP